MNFTVHWVAFAQSHLAAIWLAAPDRQAVTAAAHRIDLALARDAQLKGESREAGHECSFSRPSASISTSMSQRKRLGCAWSGITSRDNRDRESETSGGSGITYRSLL